MAAYKVSVGNKDDDKNKNKSSSGGGGGNSSKASSSGGSTSFSAGSKSSLIRGGVGTTVSTPSSSRGSGPSSSLAGYNKSDFTKTGIGGSTVTANSPGGRTQTVTMDYRGKNSNRSPFASYDANKQLTYDSKPGEFVARSLYFGANGQTQRGRDLFNSLQQEFTNFDSPLYQPYFRGTSKAIAELAQLGVQVPEDNVRDWLSANSEFVRQNKRETESTYNPTKTKRSSKDQQIAYWLYQLEKDQDFTEKAQQEWANLQKELSYKANRLDWNMSDDEIINSINWKKYPSLAKMDAGIEMGTYPELTQGMDYSRDNLYGVLFAARNPENASDNAYINTGWYYTNAGNTYLQNDAVRNAGNPNSPDFNPYRYGPSRTTDDTMEYFGVSSIDQKFIDDHKYMMNSADEKERTMYANAVQYYNNWEKIEAQAKELTEVIEEGLKYHPHDAQGLIDYVFGDGSVYEDLDMLQKVDESYLGKDGKNPTGKFVGTAQAISYDRKYIEDKIHEICGPSYNDYSGAEQISYICDKLGVDKTGITYDPLVDHEMDNAINESAGYIAQNGTPEEQDVFKNAYLYNYDNYTREVADAIVDGRMTSQEAYDMHLGYANDLCYQHYYGARNVVNRYEGLQAEKERLETQLAGNMEALNSASRDREHTAGMQQDIQRIRGQLKYINDQLAEIAPDHEEALDTLKKIDQSYEFADRIASLGGVVVPEDQKYEAREMIDYISKFDSNIDIPKYSAYSVYETSLEANSDNREKLTSEANKAVVNNTLEISAIDYFLNWAGDNNVAIPENAINNLKAYKDYLSGTVEDSKYFLLSENDDFDSVVAAAKKRIKDKYDKKTPAERWVLPNDPSWEEDIIATAIIDPKLMPGLNWTEDEKNTYIYLLEKGGPDGQTGAEAAKVFEEFIKDRTDVRKYEDIQQAWRDAYSGGNEVDNFWEAIASGAVGTIVKPFAGISASLASIVKMATGNKIYAKDPVFALNNVIGEMRQETKEGIQSLVSNPLGKDTLGFLYDALMGANDSLYSGALAGSIGLSSIVPANAFSESSNAVLRWLPKGINSFSAASLQSFSTIADTAQDLAERGIDDNTSFMLACGINFLADTVSEAVEVSDILGIDDAASFKSLWGDGSKFLAICKLCQIDDALGESASEFISGMSDYLITQKASKYDLSTDAGRIQFFKDIVYAGFNGAVSAGMSTGVSGILRRHNAKNAEKKLKRAEQQTQQRIDDMINNLDFGNGPRNQPQNQSQSQQDQTQEQTRQEPDWYDMQPDEMDMDEPKAPAKTNRFEGVSTQDLINEFSDLRDRVKGITAEMEQNNSVLEGEDRAAADQQTREMTADMRKQARQIRSELRTRYEDTYARLRSLLETNGGVMDEGAASLKAEADELEKALIAAGAPIGVEQYVDDLLNPQPEQEESAPQRNEPDWYNRDTEEEETEYPQHDRSQYEGKSTEDITSELTELVSRIEQTKKDLAEQYKLVDKKDKKYVREQNQDILNQLDEQSRGLCQELADRYVDTYTRLKDLLNANGGDMDASAMQLQAEADAIDKTLSFVGMDMNGMRQNIDDMITSRSGAEEAEGTEAGPEGEALPESNNTQISPEQAQMIRAVNALFNADQSGDQAAKSITLSSVLALSNSDHSITSLDRAGGMALARDYGDNIPQLSYLFLSAVENGQNFEDVANALSVAALKVDGTQSGRFLDLLMQKNDTHYTKEEIDGLIQRSLADINDPLLNTALLNKIVDYDTAFKVKDKIGEGRRKNSKAANKRAKVAKDQARQAADKLAESQRHLSAAQDNLNVVSQEFHANPADSALFGAQAKAQQDVVGRVNEVESNRKSAQVAQETANEAQKDADEIAGQEMAEIRQEARAEAEQEMAERRQERAEQRRAESSEQAQGGVRQGYSGTTYVGNQPITFHYAAIDTDGLVVSNDENFAPNPNYPAELQPRDRTRAADQMNINNMAKSLVPERLGESSSVQEGAPIVGSDYVVESGNGRVLAINQARGSESGARYTAWLRANAAKFGLNPEDINDRSVLVRVRESDVDRVEFARQANESNTASYSETETAVNDAKALGNDIINKFNGFNSKGSVNTLSNREFIADFVNKIIPKSQRSQYLTETGELNTRGETRIMNAVFAKAYGDTRLISMLAEGSDESKNFLKAMREVAPNVAMLDARVDAGEAFKTDLPQRITDAVKLLRDIYASGGTLSDRLDQVSMFDEGENNGVDPITAELARFFDKNKRSATKLADGILSMIDQVYNAGIPGQQTMFGEEASTPELLPIIKKTAADIASKNVLKAVSDHTATIPAAPVTSNNPRVQRDIQSGWDIIQRLSDSIGVPIDPRRSKYLRNLRRNTGGYIHPDAKVVHVQDASMVEIAMHELGHVISQVDDLANRLDTRGLLANLMNIPREAQFLSLYYDPNDVQGSQQVIEEESRAEFAKFWALDRDYAVQLAGREFVDQWESLLNDRGWLRPMQEASVQLRLNRAETVSDSERAKSYIHLEDQNNDRRQAPTEWVRKALTQVTDYTHPLQQLTDENRRRQGENYRRDQDPRELALARATASNNLFERNMFETMVDSEGNTVYRDDGTEYGSFQHIIQQIRDTDEHDFLTLFSLLDGRDRGENGKDTFGDDFDIDRAIQELQQAHPEFMPVIDQVEEWYEKFMETWLVNENNLSAEAFRHMRELYPYYIPSIVDSKDTRDHSGNRNTRGDQPADTGLRYAGGHKGAAVKNPIVMMAQYMQSYISKAKTIELHRAFDTTMTESLREDPQWANGIAELTQPDMNRVNTFNANQEALRALNREIREIMRDRNNRNDPHVRELMDRLRMTILNLPNYTWEVSDRATGADVINVVRADGSIASWTVYNKEIYDALTKMPGAKPVGRFLRAVHAFMGFFSANVTARDIGFSFMNFLSDTDTAVNYGHSSGNYIGYMSQLLRNTFRYGQEMYRASHGQETSDTYRKFITFGKLGSRYALRNPNTQRELRNQLYAHRNTIRDRVGRIVNAPIAGVEFLSGFLEDATRFNAFANNYRDGGSYSDALRAGRYAREDSTDFSKLGKEENLNPVLKKFVPFVGPAEQGIAKTIETLVLPENREERNKLLRRTALNAVIRGVAIAALRGLFWDDEDKEAYDEVRDSEKSKYFHIKFGHGDNAKFFRVKRSQDMLIQTAENIGEMIGRTFTGWEDDPGAAIFAIGKNAAMNTAISFDAVWEPFNDAMNNVNFQGIPLDSGSDLDKPPQDRWDAETPYLFRFLSSMSNTVGVKLSPAGWRYITEEFTGSMGRIGINIYENMTNDHQGPPSAVGEALYDYAARKFTIDPIYSNSLSETYYAGLDKLGGVLANAESGHSIVYFRSNLSKDEVTAGLKEAKNLTSSESRLSVIGTQIAELRSREKTVLDDNSKTESARDAEARSIRMERNKLMLEANAIIGDYFQKYGYDYAVQENLMYAAATVGLARPEKVQSDMIPQTVKAGYVTPETIHDVFKADSNMPYMQKAMQIFDSTQDVAVLPHPKYTGSYNKTKYEVEEQYQNDFDKKYRDAYNSYVRKKTRAWDRMTDKEKTDVMKYAHNHAQQKAAEWYHKLRR